MARSETSRLLGGWAAIVGGVLWVVKSGSILISGHQPPFVMEAAIPLFGLAVLALAVGRGRVVRVRTAAVLGAVGCILGTVALVSDVVGGTFDPALASAMVAILAGLVLVGWTATGPASREVLPRIALGIGLGTVPAVLVGGALSLLQWRLLELSLLVLGLLWVWLGWVLTGRANDGPAPLEACAAEG